MKTYTSLCLLYLLPSFPAIAAKTCPPPQPTSNMVQTFASEFTKTKALDPRQWAPFSGQSVGNPAIEAQAYAPSQVTMVPKSGLRLSTVPGDLLGKSYISGAVTSKELFAQVYGHFEMMAKVPETNGMWPAFWLLPDNGTWPPEIDILEYIYAPNGVPPAASASAQNFWVASNPATTLHWTDAAGAHQQTAPMIGNAIEPLRIHQDWSRKPAPVGWEPAYSGYHTYAIDWRPGTIDWLIDGAPVFCVRDTDETGKRVPEVPMYIIINDAVTNGTQSAPGWAGYVEPETAWPQHFDVAYVRVYRFKDLPAAPSRPSPK